MPRRARVTPGGHIYHVINRGNARARVFHDDVDYSTFVKLMRRATQRRPGVRLLAACVMPNHFHLVLAPADDGDLSRWMQWLGTSHARHHHRRHDTTGHVWEGRFKSFPIKRDGHLLAVMRYVERNALRARLVQRAEEWRWSSLRWRERGTALLHPPPLALPDEWVAVVNEPQTEGELEALRRSVNREAPFGDPRWQEQVAARLGLEHTLRAPGRPRKRRRWNGDGDS